MNKLASLVILTSLVMPLFASAQIRGEYLDPLTFDAPDVLPPVGTLEPMRGVFYLKKGGLGGTILKRDETLISIPEGFKGKVYVRYESELFTKVIQGALQKRGIEITDQREGADVAIWGQAQYRVHLHPLVQRLRPLNASFDKDQQPISVADGGARKKGLGDALVAVGGTAPGALVRPGEFISALVGSLFDLTGASSSMEKANNWTDKQREENFHTFLQDCYDKATRKSSCEPGMMRNKSYAYKTRMQFVELETFVKVGGQEPRKFNLVARQIDDRKATEDNLNLLVSMAVEELLSGFTSRAQEVEEQK
jgi:hypothetical protein